MHINDNQTPCRLPNPNMAYFLYNNIQTFQKRSKKGNRIITNQKLVAAKLVYHSHFNIRILQKIIIYSVCTITLRDGFELEELEGIETKEQ